MVKKCRAKDRRLPMLSRNAKARTPNLENLGLRTATQVRRTGAPSVHGRTRVKNTVESSASYRQFANKRKGPNQALFAWKRLSSQGEKKERGGE